MRKNVLSRAFTMVCTVSFSFGAAAATTEWKPDEGGFLDEPANWTEGLPRSGYDGVIGKSPSSSLTLNANTTYADAGMTIAAGQTAEFDLGEGRELTVGKAFTVGKGTTGTLKSGSIRLTDNRFFIGDNCSNSRFVVDGPTAELHGVSKTGVGNYYIQIGSLGNWNDYSQDNALEVRNGGLVEGGLIMGRAIPGATRALAGTNLFHVAGLGSRYLSPTYSLYVGQMQGRAFCVIENQATASVANAYLGTSTTFNNYTHAGSYNWLCVSNAASFQATNLLVVGNGNGSVSNAVDVVDHSTLTALELRIGDTAASTGNVFRIDGAGSFAETKKIFLGNRGPRCRLEVLNGGELSVTNAFSMGSQATAVGSTLYVGEGSTLTLKNIDGAVIGQAASNACMSVEGAGTVVEATTTSRLVIGANQTAENSRLDVRDGAELKVKRIVLGDVAPNCTLLVSNATVRIGAQLDIGYSTAKNPDNAQLVVQGSNTVVIAQDVVRMKYGTSKLVFEIPATGFVSTPLLFKKFSDMVDGASVVVRADRQWPVGSEQVLLKLSGSDTISDDDARKLRLVSETPNVVLRISDDRKQILAKRRGGLVISIR